MPDNNLIFKHLSDKLHILFNNWGIKNLRFSIARKNIVDLIKPLCLVDQSFWLNQIKFGYINHNLVKLGKIFVWFNKIVGKQTIFGWFN